MELYDICMLVVLVGTTVFGAWKGMAWQVASSASLVASYAVALRFSAQLAPRFGEQAPLNRFIAMFVLFAGTSLVIWLLFRVVAGFLNRMRLKEFDRQMGALFGAAKGSLRLIRPSLIVELYGRERYATIAGVLAAVVTVATALAPISAGAAHDLWGSYDPIFWTFVLVSIMPSGAVLLVSRPRVGSQSVLVTTAP